MAERQATSSLRQRHDEIGLTCRIIDVIGCRVERTFYGEFIGAETGFAGTSYCRIAGRCAENQARAAISYRCLGSVARSHALHMDFAILAIAIFPTAGKRSRFAV